MLGHLLGRSLGDDLAAAVAAFGTEVDNPVGRLDDIEIVLDHNDRVAQIDETIENAEQLADVVEMQTRGRLIEDVHGLAGVRAGELGGQLDALGLAAGQRRSRLPQRQVIQADIDQRLQHPMDLGNIAQ